MKSIFDSEVIKALSSLERDCKFYFDSGHASVAMAGLDSALSKVLGRLDTGAFPAEHSTGLYGMAIRHLEFCNYDDSIVAKFMGDWCGLLGADASLPPLEKRIYTEVARLFNYWLSAIGNARHEFLSMFIRQIQIGELRSRLATVYEAAVDAIDARRFESPEKDTRNYCLRSVIGHLNDHCQPWVAGENSINGLINSRYWDNSSPIGVLDIAAHCDSEAKKCESRSGHKVKQEVYLEIADLCRSMSLIGKEAQIA